MKEFVEALNLPYCQGHPGWGCLVEFIEGANFPFLGEAATVPGDYGVLVDAMVNAVVAAGYVELARQHSSHIIVAFVISGLRDDIPKGM